MTNDPREALKPFARIPLSYTDDSDDSATVFEYEGGAITLGDLRRVHEALTASPGEQKPPPAAVREQLAEALAENKALRAANTQLVLAERDRIEATLSNPPAAVESNGNAEAEFPTWDAEDEAYELGKRYGYESAVQDFDLATGGDGEFKGSTNGETVDVQVMKQRIIDRFAANASAEARLRDHKWFDHECQEKGCQSLTWKGLYETTVKGRADFRNAFREERNKSAHLRQELSHYAEEYCEGWCEQDSGCANFDDCGGCRARRALSPVGDEAKKSEGGVESDCEDQGLCATDVCTKFKCQTWEDDLQIRPRLSLKGKYWVCPKCHSSYGADAKGVAPGPSDPTVILTGGLANDVAAAAKRVAEWKSSDPPDRREIVTPRVTDNDRDEITVTLDGKELRGWSYASDQERRTKMLCARDFVEGFCTGRQS